MQLSVLTWNIWDTPYIGSRDNSERVKRLGEVLYVMRPDIALVQESFTPKRRRVLLEVLERYNTRYQRPKNVYDEKKLFGLIPFFDATGGLITLSKYPIRSSVFYPFETHGKSWDERLCEKGYTQTFVNTPKGQALVVNTHLSNRPQDNRIRLAQLDQLLEDLEGIDFPVILGGDFNMTQFSDGEQTEEFDMIEEAGFTDSLVGGERDFETFSPRNKYNRYPERGRIDYVFFRPAQKGRIKPKASMMIGVAKPLSDHYGYMATLEMNGR